MAGTNHDHVALQADRWASRRARAIAFLKTQGVSGLFRQIRQVGLAASLAFVRRNLRYALAIHFGRRWDRRHNVDTGGQIELDHVSVTGRHKEFGHPVVSTSPKIFRFLSQFFPDDCSRYTYIDLGAGKGRTVLLASGYGFRQAIGVEFVDVACAIAKRNLETYRNSGTTRAGCMMLHGDLTEYDLPNDNLVLYFGNPFLIPLWRIVLSRIAESLTASPRSIYLVLAGSQPEKIWDGVSIIRESGLFVEYARGMTPYFLDAYLPFAYAAFRTTHAPR
jgi:hypothetical protein